MEQGPRLFHVHAIHHLAAMANGARASPLRLLVRVDQLACIVELSLAHTEDARGERDLCRVHE